LAVFSIRGPFRAVFPERRLTVESVALRAAPERVSVAHGLLPQVRPFQQQVWTSGVRRQAEHRLPGGLKRLKSSRRRIFLLRVDVIRPTSRLSWPVWISEEFETSQSSSSTKRLESPRQYHRGEIRTGDTGGHVPWKLPKLSDFGVPSGLTHCRDGGNRRGPL
jgi:hypothetical protein